MSPRPAVLPKFLCLSLLLFFGAIARGQMQPRVVNAIDNAKKTTLAGNVHPLAKAEFDRGAVADAQPMNRILLLLKRSDAQEAALADALEKQQDKSSASYHKWMTPEQFGALYGPADADIQAVTQWLAAQGFTVAKVYRGKTVIEFSGTAGQVRAAFGTDIRNYQVSGKSYIANASDPQIPAALAPVVAGIVSLNNFPRTFHSKRLGAVRKVAGKPGLQPLFTYPSPFGDGEIYGLGPGDFATIYNSKGLIGGGNDGKGTTIEIVGETNLNVQDVMDFRTAFGLPATFSASNVILNGEDPGITSTGEEGEADLDVQWSGAVAPGATVNLVVSASTTSTAGIDLSALYIIEHNAADVMSESYGSCEAGLGAAGNAFYNSLWQQAAAQGITVVVSSGDGGSAGCDNFDTESVATRGLAVSGIASTPYNVSVGGTDFDQVNKWSTYWSTTNAPVTQTSALSYIPEIPWNENCAQIGLTGCGANAPSGSLNIVAGSGGQSSVYAKPTWQMGVAGMPNDSHRDQPDVSLFASPGFDGTGYLICQQDGTNAGYGRCYNSGPNIYSLQVVGGTSASAPSFAGVMALVDQHQAGRQGNANYVLYALANKAGNSCASSTTEAAGCVFNDVTKGNSALPTGAGVGTNSVPCQGGTLNCSSTIATVNGVLVDPSHATTEAWTAAAGYDMASGLGSVNINNLATSWGTVSTVSTTTTLTLTPLTGITHGTGENVSVTIGVTPKSGTATGIVSLIAKFADGTTRGLDQFSLGANGSFSGKTQNLPGGTNYQVYAHYAGDGVNAPSDSTAVTVSVTQEASKTFIIVPLYDIQTGNLISGNASSVPYGSPYRIRMYVTNSSGTANPTGPPAPTCDQVNELTCPTGTITLTANGTGVDRVNGVYSLDNIGYTRDINPTLGGGSYALVAQYNGDNSYSSSTSATDSLTVTLAPTTTTLLEASSGGVVGSQIALNLTVQANSLGAAPTGSFTVYDNGVAITTNTNQSNSQPGTTTGVASLNVALTFTLSVAGTHAYTATYNGDANYAASTTATPITINVQNPTTTTVTVSSNNVIFGNPVTLTAIVDTTVKTPTPTNNVQFASSLDGVFSGTVTYKSITDASGNAALQASLVVTPKYTEIVWASFGGDSNFASSTSLANNVVPITVTVPDFNVTPGQFNVAVTAGQPSNTTVTVTPVTNLPSQVQLSVQNPFLVGVSCGVTPSTVSLSNQQAATATLNCNVPAPSGSTTVTSELMPPLSGPGFWANRNLWRAGAVAVLLGMILFLLPLRLRVRRFSYACFSVGLVGLLIGCGGGSGTGGGGGGGGGNGPTPTSLSFTIANTKFPEQTTVTYTVSVTGTQSPTGTVSINNVTTGGNFGYVTLANGQATGQLSIDAPGAFSVTAAYSGDAKNLPSQTKTPLVLVATGSANSVSLSAATGADVKNYPMTITVQ